MGAQYSVWVDAVAIDLSFGIVFFLPDPIFQEKFHVSLGPLYQ